MEASGCRQRKLLRADQVQESRGRKPARKAVSLTRPGTGTTTRTPEKQGASCGTSLRPRGAPVSVSQFSRSFSKRQRTADSAETRAPVLCSICFDALIIGILASVRSPARRDASITKVVPAPDPGRKGSRRRRTQIHHHRRRFGVPASSVEMGSNWRRIVRIVGGTAEDLWPPSRLLTIPARQLR